jgi:hypothetical protein
MRSLLRGLWIVRQSAMTSPIGFQEAIEIHVRTLRSVTRGDPQAVAVAMDEHLSFLEHHWEAETGRALVRKTPDFLLPAVDGADHDSSR